MHTDISIPKDMYMLISSNYIHVFCLEIT